MARDWRGMMENLPDNVNKSCKLNILNLPSHTSILFALIALVVLGAALASLLPGSQLCWAPIVLGLTLLPLRDFLRRPDHEISRWKMAHHPDEQPTVVLERELASLGADRPPKVIITDRFVEAHAFGSFRRIYLGLGRPLAEQLSSGLQDPDSRRRKQYRTILAHELSHFINKDVWLVWLSRGLLKMMILVMVLNLWIGLNFASFLIENGPEVLQSEFWIALSQHMFSDIAAFDLLPIYNSLCQQNPELIERLADPTSRVENWRPFLFNLTSSHWPFAISGILLFLIHWPWLLRVRELYADARAASLMGEAAIVREALSVYGILVGLAPTVPSRWRRLREWFSSLPKRIPLLSKLLARRPSPKQRIKCLADPTQAFGSWCGIVVSGGLAVALLDLVLRGTLTTSYVYEPGSHLPFLAAFLILATWLLPQICVAGSLRQGLARKIVLIASLFTVVRLIPQLLDAIVGLLMLLGDKENYGALLDLWVYSMFSGFATEVPRIVGVEVSWSQIIEWHMMRPLAYFALLMPPTLSGFLLTDAWLKRRVLTWYRLGKRVRRLFWGISGLLALFLALVVIPVYNRLFFPHVYEGWSAAMLAGMVFTLVVVLAGGALFWYYDRKLAERCPYCNTLVPETYHLGKRCEACNWLLHPWLIANY